MDNVKGVICSICIDLKLFVQKMFVFFCENLNLNEGRYVFNMLNKIL